MEVKVADVVFRDDLYPRLQTNPVTVQKYAEDLSVLPKIEINQKNELIDGWHRWTAHKKVGAERIKARVTTTASDAELLELAIERNASHGLQLSQEDKRAVARRIYSETPLNEQGEMKKKLSKLLSVSLRVVQDWLSRIDKDNKEARDVEIRNLWLGCCTLDEISERMGMPKQTVADICTENANFRSPYKLGEFREMNDEKERLDAIENANRTAAAHVDEEFDPPLYNVWKQQTKTEGPSHPGNTEVRLLDNLLYLYTDPFDVVIDPFAGSGSTIDICKRRLRRHFVSDRNQVPEREKEIRNHDLVTDGLPKPPQWKDVQLVYLDPPYWKQAEGQYSDDDTDLANMPLDQFNKTLAGIINGFAGKLRTGAVVALIMQPTQWKAPERKFTDHVADMLRLVKLPIDMRFSVPYESQQCTAQMVNWAKQQKKCLVLTREIVVWRIE
jgi:hypothetical protein